MKEEIPSELRYTKSHEWAKHDDGVVIVGITDHAQHLAGDVVYVELPEIDTPISAGEEVGVIESAEAATDLYSPITGTIVAVNHTLADNPGLINSDPYATGWIFKVQADDDAEIDELLTDEEYQDIVDAEND